jgi:hypothetical protein
VGEEAMTKTLWMFMLLLLLVLAVNVRSQGLPLPPNAVLVDFGQQWTGANEVARLWYLTGFKDGSADAYQKAFENEFRVPGRTYGQVAGQFEPVRLVTFTAYDPDVLSRVITDLYRDPANTFISHAGMVYIARDRLDGKNVEPLLREARVSKRAYTLPKTP